jgi:hypothetical protein
MRIPDAVLDCVAFVGVPCSSGRGEQAIQWVGTGFFISLPSGSGAVWYHFVTAKHVAERVNGRDCILRVNTVDGGYAQLSGDGLRWHFHPSDPSVDAAVCDIELQSDIRYNVVPIDMFITEAVMADRDIGVGDEVFVTGLFTRRSGFERNIPVVRRGSLAAMAGERVPTKRYGAMEAHLVELRSTGGVSGSPAFVAKTFPFNQKGTIRFGGNSPLWECWLLGLVHGHWNLTQQDIDELALEEDKLGDEVEKINTGIGLVVPAGRILEVINHPELVAMRASHESELLAANAPDED